MIVAEGNKPEKFREVFEKAREKGADKRQARHLANYKIGLESLGKKELFEKYTKDRPARIQKMLLAAQDRKLKTELMKAQTRDLDPRYKLRKDIEKLPLGLGNKEGEGFILNVSAILKAQNPEKYEAKNPGAGDVIEDLTNESTRLVAIRAATLMKENPGTTLNDATLIAFDQLYKTGQLKEDQLLGFLW